MSDEEKNSSSDSEEDIPKKKPASKKRKNSSESDSDVDRPSPTPPRKKPSGKPDKKKPSKVEEKEPKWKLENDRFVTVREFKGRVMVDIREFYTDKGTGELRPGKKGISLSAKQWANMKSYVQEIDSAVKKMTD